MLVIFVSSEPKGAVVKTVPASTHFSLSFVRKVRVVKAVGSAELRVASLK